MKETKIKEMSRLEKILVQILGTMILVNGALAIAYWLSGSVEIAAFAAALTATITFANFAAFAAAITLATSAAFAAAIAFVTFAAFVALVPVFVAVFVAVGAALGAAFAAAIIFATSAAFAFAEIYKVKYWKALLVLGVEVGLLFVAFTCYVPYLAIGLLCVSVFALSAIMLRRVMV